MCSSGSINKFINRVVGKLLMNRLRDQTGLLTNYRELAICSLCLGTKLMRRISLRGALLIINSYPSVVCRGFCFFFEFSSNVGYSTIPISLSH